MGAEHFSHIFGESLRVVKNLSLDPVCNLSIILIHVRNCPPGPHLLSSCFYLNNPRNSGFVHLRSLQGSKAIRVCLDSSTHLPCSNPSWLVVPSPFHRARDEPVAPQPSLPGFHPVCSVCQAGVQTSLSVFHQSLHFFPCSLSNEGKLIIKVNTSVSDLSFTLLQEKKCPCCFQFI